MELFSPGGKEGEVRRNSFGLNGKQNVGTEAGMVGVRVGSCFSPDKIVPYSLERKCVS